MNIPLNDRMQRTISNIQNRSNKPKALIPASIDPMKHRGSIPKRPFYYRQLKEKAKVLNDPYLSRIYSRAEKLARDGKHKEINRLLFIANETIKQKRAPQQAAQSAPMSNHKAHVRQLRKNVRSRRR